MADVLERIFKIDNHKTMKGKREYLKDWRNNHPGYHTEYRRNHPEKFYHRHEYDKRTHPSREVIIFLDKLVERVNTRFINNFDDKNKKNWNELSVQIALCKIIAYKWIKECSIDVNIKHEKDFQKALKLEFIEVKKISQLPKIEVQQPIEQKPIETKIDGWKYNKSKAERVLG